jgi:hypothetical protein
MTQNIFVKFTHLLQLYVPPVVYLLSTCFFFCIVGCGIHTNLKSCMQLSGNGASSLAKKKFVRTVTLAETDATSNKVKQVNASLPAMPSPADLASRLINKLGSDNVASLTVDDVEKPVGDVKIKFVVPKASALGTAPLGNIAKVGR